MEQDSVNLLIQLAYLEGRIQTRGAYEKSVERKPVQSVADPSSRNRLIQRLEGALEQSSHRVESQTSVGSYLKAFRAEQKIRSTDISSRLGMSPNIYALLEQDRILPFKISVGMWKKFRMLFGLGVDELAGMLRCTCTLIDYRPAYNATLARYDTRKGLGRKRASVEVVLHELFSSPDLSLPQEHEARLAQLVQLLGDDVHDEGDAQRED